MEDIDFEIHGAYSLEHPSDISEIYDDFYMISESLAKKYGNHYCNDIDSSLLNVILVLTGARMACIIDSIRFNTSLLNELLEILLDYYNLSMIRLTAVEFLVFLTVNKDFVNKEYRLNMANLLGYCYTQSDFANRNIDRIAVEYFAKSKISGYKISLFTTVIPAYTYQEPSIQRCILDQVYLFDSILSNLDYTVSISTRYI